MKHCVEVERWRGPPHVNKVKQYELCLFIQFSLLIKNILLLNKVFLLLLLLLISFWTGHYILTTWALSVPLQVPGPQVGPPPGPRWAAGGAAAELFPQHTSGLGRTHPVTSVSSEEEEKVWVQTAEEEEEGRKVLPRVASILTVGFFFSQLRKVLEPTRPDRA